MSDVDTLQDDELSARRSQLQGECNALRAQAAAAKAAADGEAALNLTLYPDPIQRAVAGQTGQQDVYRKLTARAKDKCDELARVDGEIAARQGGKAAGSGSKPATRRVFGIPIPGLAEPELPEAEVQSMSWNPLNIVKRGLDSILSNVGLAFDQPAGERAVGLTRLVLYGAIMVVLYILARRFVVGAADFTASNAATGASLVKAFK